MWETKTAHIDFAGKSNPARFDESYELKGDTRFARAAERTCDLYGPAKMSHCALDPLPETFKRRCQRGMCHVEAKQYAARLVAVMTGRLSMACG